MSAIDPVIIKKLFELLYEKSKLIDFVYYPKDGTIRCSKRFIKQWNCSDLLKNVPDTFVNTFVAPQDKDKVKDFFNSVSIENQKNQCVFKNITGNQTFTLEFRIAQSDENNQPVSLIGVLENITGQTSISTEKPTIIVSTDRKLKVLVVDDSKVNLLVAENIFKNFNFDCSYVQSGQEAVELCKKIQFDLIFMDLLMPVMDGLETKNIIRSLTGYETTPIIALTAATEQNAREELLDKGFNEFLSKPFNSESLSKTVSVFVSDIPAIDAAIEDKSQNLVNKDILNQVYKDGTKKLRYLPELIEKKDFSNYVIEVHALKSVMAAIGEQALSNHAREHEIRGKNKEYDFVINDFENLHKEYTEIINKIGQQLDIKVPVEGTLPPLSNADFNKVSEALKTACKDYDSNRLKELCTELQKHKCSSEIYEIISVIYDAADSYDYETVENKINELCIHSVHSNIIIVDRIQSFIGNTILSNLISKNLIASLMTNMEEAFNSNTDFIILFIESDLELIKKQAEYCNKSAIKKLFLLGNESDIKTFETLTDAAKILGKYYRPINAKAAVEQIVSLM